MISEIKNFRNIGMFLFVLAGLTLATSACNKRDYPCPGLGQSNEADLSLFDEEGKLKSDKDHGRIDKGTGLIKKKKPKKLNARRRTHI